jgi:hypothetical protein
MRQPRVSSKFHPNFILDTLAVKIVSVEPLLQTDTFDKSASEWRAVFAGLMQVCRHGHLRRTSDLGAPTEQSRSYRDVSCGHEDRSGLTVDLRLFLLLLAALLAVGLTRLVISRSCQPSDRQQIT